MSDIGKIPNGFTDIERTKLNNPSQVKTDISAPHEEKSTETELQQVTAQHFIPGQVQIPNDNFASDVDFMQKHPELVEVANDIYDKIYQDCIDCGESEIDAAGKAANVQAQFVQEVLGH